jgi:hypothetical protein
MKVTNGTERKYNEIWYMMAAVFSAGTFVFVITAFTIQRVCKRRERDTRSEPKSAVSTEQGYQALHNKTVFSGMANVIISLNDLEKNFSVFMKTEESTATFQLDGVVSNGLTTCGNSANGSEKVYESLL